MGGYILIVRLARAAGVGRETGRQGGVAAAEEEEL